MALFLEAIGVLFLIYIFSRQYEWRCPLCDFHSKQEDDVKAHLAYHARHKPALKEIY